ncbi:MAG: iron-sulfur cluster assembly scaffold protein [Helicobacteraceae bacterium]|jgi:nitrogen fixation NifU-like protein|nr:iron-sulfur cluster assembly scaffold protein [Helicobacteraceae bacterium]
MEEIEMPEGMNPEVLKHIMNPQNYGKLTDPDGTGVAMDDKTGEFVIFTVHLSQEGISDINFATNGCQDTVVVGSMFTEMVKNESVEYAQGAITKIEEKLGVLSPQQKICADMVFNAFVAALINVANLAQGKKEEIHIIKSEESCEVAEGDSNE